MAESLGPDVILIDVGLPGINGLEAARRISRVLPEAKIIFATQQTSSEFVAEAFSLGAHGYVIKARIEQDLQAALESVCRGQRFLSPGLEISES